MSLTLRFEKHNDLGHQVYSCDRYSVSYEPTAGQAMGVSEAELDGKKVYFTNNLPACSSPTRRIIKMYRSMSDENPYFESVGDLEPYSACYVMNDSGKTIDTIRA